jgi:uncharacterized membrane protein (UPF0127 family)
VKIFTTIGFLAITAGAMVFLAYFWQGNQMGSLFSPGTLIHVGKTSVIVEIVRTEEARERGLSGRDALSPGHGMLFMFESEGLPGIWMKDMKFPIDIIWADKDGAIVTIARKVAPESYPAVFTPKSPSLYVLEVPPGFADQYGIAEGDKIVL